MPYGIRDEVWNKLPADDRAAIAATAKGKPPPPIGGYAPPPAAPAARAATPAPPPNLSAGIGSRIEPTGDYPVATPVMTPTRATVGKALADGRTLAEWTLASREAQIGKTGIQGETPTVSRVAPGPAVEQGPIHFAIVQILDQGRLVRVRVTVEVSDPPKQYTGGSAIAQVSGGPPRPYTLGVSRSFVVSASPGHTVSVTEQRRYVEPHLDPPESKKQETEEVVDPFGLGLHYFVPKVEEKGRPPQIDWEPSTEGSHARVRVVRVGGVILLEVVGP